jgi:hypothetical protein
MGVSFRRGRTGWWRRDEDIECEAEDVGWPGTCVVVVVVVAVVVGVCERGPHRGAGWVLVVVVWCARGEAGFLTPRW